MSEQITEMIIQRFVAKGSAQGVRNVFKFVETVSGGVHVLRECGTIWLIRKEQIEQAVNAVRQEPAIYSTGPSRLKPYITGRVQSPLWAMLHLVSLDEILS